MTGFRQKTQRKLACSTRRLLCDVRPRWARGLVPAHPVNPVHPVFFLVYALFGDLGQVAERGLDGLLRVLVIDDLAPEVEVQLVAEADVTWVSIDERGKAAPLPPQFDLEGLWP